MAGVLPGSEPGHGERVECPGHGADADGARAGVRLGGEVVSGGAGAEAAQVGAGGRIRRVQQGSVPDQREPKPGRVTAYEQSLKNYTKKKSNVVIDPSVGTSFDSRGEAFDFYNLYSWEMGFGIRWGGSTKDPAKDIIMEQIIRCCQGKPEGNAVLLSTDCQAMIRLHRSDDNGWYIKEFRGDHNHPLYGSCNEQSSWPSHKHLNPDTKVLVCHLRDNSVDLSKMHGIIAGYFEVIKNVVFNKTDLKTLSKYVATDHFQDDVNKTIELFHDFGSLRRDDPSFMYLVEVDDSDDQLKTLLCTNRHGRIQYAHFGDAITFDTTHKTNLYDMRFGLFLGSNNHHQPVILGGVLMQHESVESFKWIFREFVELMGGKAPSTILTDPCHAMEVAIQDVLPATTHRWCKLHLLNKESGLFGRLCLKNNGFKDAFNKIINGMLTEIEFESAWQHLLDKYSLHGNAFLSQFYDSRHRWAKPFFRGKFGGRQTSRQISETANNLVKGYVPPNNSINMFVRHYNKIQSALASKESFEEGKSRQKSRIMSKGVPVEEHAAKIYTRAMFEKFSEAIFESGSYVVDEKEKGKAYLARHIRSDRRETWSQVEFEVTIRAEDGAVVCECGLGEHMGMPCCHAVKVMIHLGMQEIPAGNIVKRWTTNARDVLPAYLIEYDMDTAAKSSQAVRFAVLYIIALEAAKLASSSDEAFQIAVSHLNRLEKELLEHCQVMDDFEMDKQSSECSTQSSDVEEMSAVTRDDATSATLKRSMETEAPGRKRKIQQHAQAARPH